MPISSLGLAVAGACVVAIAAKLVSNRLEYALAGPSIYITSCIVTLGALASCVWRAMRDRSGYREGWLALALAIGCTAISVIFLTVMGLLDKQNVDALIPLSLLVVYGVPITFVLASPTESPWLARVVDGLAAIVLSALFLVFIAQLLQPDERLDSTGATTVEALFDVQNIFIFLLALVRFVASSSGRDRSFYGGLALYAAFHTVTATICNRVVRELPVTSDLNIFYDASGLAIAAVALCFHLPPRYSQGRDRFARVVQVGIPFALPLSILTLSIALAGYQVTAALAGCAAALVLFGMRMVLAQLQSMDERDRFAQLSQMDALTGLPNRRKFDTAFRTEIARASRVKHGMAVLMIDIDNFKQINDTLGHPVGDDWLRHVAETVRKHAARSTDLVARYGGEEFITVLLGLNPAEALAQAEKLRAAVEALALESPAPAGRVTVSIGIAWAMISDPANGERLVEQADEALYRSKRAGRNRVTAAWMD